MAMSSESNGFRNIEEPGKGQHRQGVCCPILRPHKAFGGSRQDLQDPYDQLLLGKLDGALHIL